MKNMAERLQARAENLVQLDTRKTGISTHRYLQLLRLQEYCDEQMKRQAGAATGAASIGNEKAALHFIMRAGRFRRICRKLRKRLEKG